MRNKALSLIFQERRFKQVFPTSKIIRFREASLICTLNIQPTPLSQSYKIKLKYERNKNPIVFVIEPKKLKLAAGKTELPHVYSTEKQQLCLFYPKYKEWNTSMYLVDSIIAWVSEWFLYYEIWLGCGEWHGGGIHLENTKKV